MEETKFFLIAAFVFFLIGIVAILIRIELKRVCCKKANAKIVSIQHLVRNRKVEDAPIYVYWVKGQEFKKVGKKMNSSSNLHVGDESFVLYNPENPRQVIIEGKMRSGIPGYLSIACGIIFMIFAIAL